MKTKWVIKLFEQYWVKEQESSCLEIYDLEQATQYDTKKSAQDFINKTRMAEHSIIVKYDDVISEFLEWKKNGMIRRTIPLTISSRYNGEGMDDVIKFHLFTRGHEMAITHEDYMTWPNINKFTKHFGKIIFVDSDDYSELYCSFDIKLNRDDYDFEVFKNELNKLIPYVSYKDAGGRLIFWIMDKDLSEFGTRYLYYNTKEDKHVIYESRFVEHKGTLKQLFDIIRKDYYYE